MSSSYAWLLVACAAVNSCIGNLLLKKSRLVAVDGGMFEQFLSPWFLGGLAFYGVNVLLFAKALDDLPVSTAYPVLAGLGFALLVLFSNILYREVLSFAQGLGVILIVVGIFLVAK